MLCGILTEYSVHRTNTHRKQSALTKDILLEMRAFWMVLTTLLFEGQDMVLRFNLELG